MGIIKDNPIESIATFVGIIIITVGIILSQNTNVNILISNFLTLMGSFLSSVATTWAFGKSAAKKQISAKLDLLRGQLATTASQISYSVSLGWEDEDNAVISLSRIEQSLSSLGMIISEMDNLTESRFSTDKEKIVDAKMSLIDLGNRINKLIEFDTVGKSHKVKLTNQVNEIMTKLDKIDATKTLYKGKPKQKVELKPINHPPKVELLSYLRKLGMQYIGKEPQMDIIKSIHEELTTNLNFRTIKEIRETLMNDKLNQLVKYGAISKSKIGGILKIFMRAGVFDTRKENEMLPTELKLHPEYNDINKFINSHHLVFFAIADVKEIKSIYVYDILGLDKSFEVDLVQVEDIRKRIEFPEIFTQNDKD